MQGSTFLQKAKGDSKGSKWLLKCLQRAKRLPKGKNDFQKVKRIPEKKSLNPKRKHRFQKTKMASRSKSERLPKGDKGAPYSWKLPN